MKISVYAIIAAILIASAVGWGEMRFAAGREKERNKHLNAVLEHGVEMAKLRKAHAQELEGLATEYAQQYNLQSGKLRALLQENKKLMDWWNTPVPTPIADYAWMRPASDSAMRSGPDAAATNPAPSKAGEPH
jgi:hypothetical protein